MLETRSDRSDHWTCKRRVDFLVERANDVGVFLGAARPNRTVALWPGKKSPTVSTSGSASERVAGLLDLGWAEGRNLNIDYRWPVDDIKRTLNVHSPRL